MQLASVDGSIGPAEEARVPVTDEGLTRGDGAFEVMRLYGGRPYGLTDHYARLARSCAGIRLEADFDALSAEVDALLEAAGPIDGLIRIVLTRGGRRILTIEPLPAHPAVARVMTVRYAPNRVLEGPTWSFFWVSGGQLLTPPIEDRILASITRAHVIEECEATERPCTLDDLAGAEEAFIASTVRVVVPIAAVDEIALPAAPGPVSLDARERVGRRIERELSSSV
jgi:branched-chain amino acid aminotransferase